MAHIPAQIDFTVDDRASSHIDEIISKADKLSSTFDSFSTRFATLVGAAGGLAGAFGFTHMIEQAGEHIAQVRRLKAITGQTAETADGLGEAFELAGISAEETSTILGRMSLTALKLEDATMGIAGPGGGASLMQRAFHHLGVDLRGGVVPAMMKLADKVKEGKVSAMDLRLAMRGLPLDSAIKFQRMLSRGSGDLKHIMDEVGQSSTAVTDDNIKAFATMKRAQNEMNAAFKRLTLLVGRELYPVLAELMKDVADRVKSWIPAVREFGRFLSAHLREGITLALTMSKILLANAVLAKTTGHGLIGRSGLVGRGVGMVRNFAIAGGMAAAGAGAGPVQMWMAAAAAGGPVLLALVAAAAIVVGGFQAIASNLNGARDWLFDGIDGLIAALDSAMEAFGGVTSSEVWDFFSMILPKALNSFVHLITGVIVELQIIIRFLIENVRRFESGQFFTKGFVGYGDVAAEVEADVQARKDAKAAARSAAASHAADGKAEFNQHFYGARFDITQKFEEGFDPDRILTAFTNDLAALGERGITSGFGPAFAGSVGKG